MPVTLTAASESFVTLDEAKAHANVTGGSHDAELDMFRGAAQEAVEGIIGPVLHRTVTETHRVTGYGSILLRQRPIVEVTSVTVAGVALTYTGDTQSGLLYVRGWGDVVATYVAGRTVVPDSIRVAALIIAEHLWRTQRGTAPSGLQGEDAGPPPGLGYSIPNRAVDLLRPYMLPPAVG